MCKDLPYDSVMENLGIYKFDWTVDDNTIFSIVLSSTVQ